MLISSQERKEVEEHKHKSRPQVINMGSFFCHLFSSTAVSDYFVISSEVSVRGLLVVFISSHRHVRIRLM